MAAGGSSARWASFAVNPPITECRYPALTLQLDTSQFVDEAFLCPKFVMEDKERHTYRLHVSNLRGFPVMLRLPTGVKPHSVTPQAANPVTQLMVQVGQERGLAVLPGGGELVLDVNALDLPKGARIAGALDLTGVIMDTGVAIFRVVTGYEWNDRVIEAIGKTQEFADAVACVMDQSERIAKQFHSIGAAKLAWEFTYAASGCMSTKLIVAAASVYAKFNYEAYNYDEVLQKALRATVARVVTLIENAPAVTQIAATMLAARSGKTTFGLGIELEDPAVSNLYKALPTPATAASGVPRAHRSARPTAGSSRSSVRPAWSRASRSPGRPGRREPPTRGTTAEPSARPCRWRMSGRAQEDRAGAVHQPRRQHGQVRPAKRRQHHRPGEPRRQAVRRSH